MNTGVQQYMQWARDEFGQQQIPSNIKEPDRILFFNNSVTESLYRDFVSKLLQRTNTVTGQPYSADDGILMFDLMNVRAAAVL